MAASENSINKVRSILGKMDRSITDARRRRLGEPEPRPSAVEHEDDQILIGRAEDAEQTPAANKPTEPQPPEPLSPMRARYGKARPISSPNGFGGSSSNGQHSPSNGHPNSTGNGPLGFQARPA